MLYKSRDFVPGYSRFARYWLPARSLLLVPLWERLTVIRLGFEPRTHCVLVGANAKKRFIDWNFISSVKSVQSVFVHYWVFFRTRIYRIDADASVVGRYCLPDSCHYMLYKSRDFVPGYSRFARYWLPARSPLLVPLWERLTVIRLGYEPSTHCVLVGAYIYTKKSNLFLRMLLIICWVIRLGFEPRTHSLEGCCSNPTELPNQSH